MPKTLNPFHKYFQMASALTLNRLKAFSMVGLLLIGLNLVGCGQTQPVKDGSSVQPIKQPGQNTDVLTELPGQQTNLPTEFGNEFSNQPTKPAKEYWASLIAELETRIHTAQNVYVHPLTLRVLGKQKADAKAFDQALHEALLNSKLLKPLNPRTELRATTFHALRQRAQRGARGMSLMGDLLQADSELTGKVQLTEQHAIVEIQLTDRYGDFLATAHVEIPKSRLTYQMLAQAEMTPEAPSLVSQGDLKLEMTTLHGAHDVTYLAGEYLHLLIRTNKSAYVYVFVSDVNQHVTRLYPENIQVPPQPVTANQLFILPDDGLPYKLPVQPPFGPTTLWVVAITEPIEFPIEMDDAWSRMPTLPGLVREVSLGMTEGYVEAAIVVETIGQGDTDNWLDK